MKPKSLKELKLGVNQWFNDGNKNYQVTSEPTDLTEKEFIEACEENGSKRLFNKYHLNFYKGKKELSFTDGQIIWNKVTHKKGKFHIGISGGYFVSYDSIIDSCVDLNEIEAYNKQDVLPMNYKFLSRSRVFIGEQVGNLGNISSHVIIMTTGGIVNDDESFEAINLLTGLTSIYPANSSIISWKEVTNEYHLILSNLF